MTTCEEFVQSLIDSELMSPSELQGFVQNIPAADRPTTGEALARCLVDKGKLTRYQADSLLRKQFDRLSIGQYDVLEQIGAGGMGAVYKARHRRMNRTVAIKMIIPRYEDADVLIKRFEREVELISSLQHPNIVVAYDADECPTGPFLVMEYVPGVDLEVIVQKNGPLSVADARDYAIQSARGLEYSHAHNVIHRDIKPANLIRVHDTGCIKITDLGLARLKDDQDADDAPVSSSLTQTGSIIGTVLFMAPEQSMDNKTTDHRCDIYSLGCTLYFLIHARPPFVGDTQVDTIVLHRKGKIPSLREGRPDVPESLDIVYQKMVAKSPGQRFQTMDEVVAALEACDIDSGISIQPKRTHSPDAVAVTEDMGKVGTVCGDVSVLLVEPSGAQAMLIRGFLESLGVSLIQRCSRGDEALQAISKFGPGVVVSAMHLDDMTGLDLARQISENTGTRQLGFVLISSSLDASELRDKASGIGAILLAKPFAEQQLSGALREAVITSSGEI